MDLVFCVHIIWMFYTPAVFWPWLIIEELWWRSWSRPGRVNKPEPNSRVESRSKQSSSQTWTQVNVLGLDFLRCLPFTHEQRSRRFFAQTHSQQHRVLRSVHVRGGAACPGRMKFTNSAVEITCFCLQHIVSSVDPHHQNVSWHLCLCLLRVCCVCFLKSWDICICRAHRGFTRGLPRKSRASCIEISAESSSK